MKKKKKNVWTLMKLWHFSFLLNWNLNVTFLNQDPVEDNNSTNLVRSNLIQTPKHSLFFVTKIIVVSKKITFFFISHWLQYTLSNNASVVTYTSHKGTLSNGVKTFKINEEWGINKKNKRILNKPKKSHCTTTLQ